MKIDTFNKHAKQIEAVRQAALDGLALALFDKSVKPTLLKLNLGYCTMNGWPKFYDIHGKQKPMPKRLYRYFEELDIDGPAFWRFPDYNPHKQDFSSNDIKHQNQQVGRLVQYVFSPAFS